jgi:5S rRNA maturation endonuclease (ribonuclease M5)
MSLKGIERVRNDKFLTSSQVLILSGSIDTLFMGERIMKICFLLSLTALNAGASLFDTMESVQQIGYEKTTIVLTDPAYQGKELRTPASTHPKTKKKSLKSSSNPQTQEPSSTHTDK